MWVGVLNVCGLYYHLFHTAYSPADDHLQFDVLKYYVEQINMQLKSPVANQPAEDNFVVCQQLRDSQSSKLIVAISTPVMK